MNERLVECFEDIIDESEKCMATGAGITGGDPLAVPERTLDLIR